MNQLSDHGVIVLPQELVEFRSKAIICFHCTSSDCWEVFDMCGKCLFLECSMHYPTELFEGNEALICNFNIIPTPICASVPRPSTNGVRCGYMLRALLNVQQGSPRFLHLLDMFLNFCIL